ncbi:hypothetical protein SAMN05444280_13342 [Tangfeifania diversioriginum]|uniref:DNA polymerase-3 subunit alpha n=1 Tax=Tangfeifania diversioriginum TaxID=1168035 RepID=A0A1M6MJN7_9BACT|nr:hypothetical protein [Tangfeifania diversioriginum]SHJ83709.1 hypothetical protein SAMN05444280_13342 [Tangfeifania diversioriginum]
MWEAHLHLKKPAKQHHTPSLFGSEHKKFQLPAFQHEKLEDAYDEIELLGFPLSVNNFDMLQTSFRGQIMARDLANNIGRKVKMTGNLVTIKYVRTIKREIMHFGTFLDYTGEFFDTVHFPDSLKKYPFRGNGVYLI